MTADLLCAGLFGVLAGLGLAALVVRRDLAALRRARIENEHLLALCDRERRTRHALELRLGPSEGDPNAGECPDCGAPAGECWLPWTTKCRRAPCG